MEQKCTHIIIYFLYSQASELTIYLKKKDKLVLHKLFFGIKKEKSVHSLTQNIRELLWLWALHDSPLKLCSVTNYTVDYHTKNTHVDSITVISKNGKANKYLGGKLGPEAECWHGDPQLLLMCVTAHDKADPLRDCSVTLFICSMLSLFKYGVQAHQLRHDCSGHRSNCSRY